MTVDPYPATLAELDNEVGGFAGTPPVDSITANPDAVTNRLTAALNRLAQAVEQNTLALGGRPAQNVAPQAVLAALPPVQTVADKPSCTFHGPDKVASSTNGKGGFYCQSKAGPGQPANPKGYCVWHS